jgi:hypothetical protein
MQRIRRARHCSLRHRWGVLLTLTLLAAPASARSPWVEYEPDAESAKDKRIVLVAGDEEYRSEEALPQLGKILAKRHGFHCTVLFPIHPDTGHINPDYRRNIPGLEQLENANLMVLFTRFRTLPADQMEHIVSFLRAGKPLIAIRPSVVAFRYPKQSEYRRYGDRSKVEGWKGGFGARVLGQTWVSHHGAHGRQGTRGLIARGAADHAITNGINDGDICGPTDVYTVTLPMDDSKPLVLGQVLQGTACDSPAVEGKLNDPMMPIAWLCAYRVNDGKRGRSFTTTIGAAEDFQSAGLRRLVVNATYQLLSLTVPARADVRPVGDYNPSPYGFGKYQKNLTPQHYTLPDADSP